MIPAAALALVVVVVAASVIVTLLNRGGYDKVKFAAFSDVGQPLPMSERAYTAFSHVAGDRAYFAYTTEQKKLTVVAADAKSGKQLWSQDVPEASDSWEGIRAVPGAVLASADAIGSTEPRRLSVLNPDNGSRMWSIDLFGEDQTFVVADRLVVVDRKNAKLVGYGLRDGDRKWDLDTPKNQYDDTKTTVYGAQTPTDVGGPADFAGTSLDPDRDDDNRLVQISADRSARVIDAVTGDILDQQPNVADPGDLATVYDGQLFTTRTTEGTELFAADLDALDKPRSIYRAADPQRRAAALSACGEKRICLLEQTSFDTKTTELVAVPVAGDGATWTKPAAGVDTILPVGTHVLLQSDESGTDHVVGYDATGKQVLDSDGVAARVNGASVLIFGKAPSISASDYNVVGWVLGAKQPVQLGALIGVRSSTCTWSTSVIACAGDEDLRLRRFAE